ncbi:DNA helicase [Tanacetum coccineum]|uniref:DNA helicase n=1 Tax=Tanacetum coccineum TaxID=301880 RepID=A0ABQ5FX43_9ASTR
MLLRFQLLSESSNTVSCSENYVGRGPLVLEFEKCVVRSVGDNTELVGVEACNSRNRDGCNVLGTSFVGDYYVDYSRQSAIVWPPGESSSGVLSGIQTGTSIASPVHTNTGDQNALYGESNFQTDVGATSSANFSQQRKIHGVCKRQERKRARSFTVGNGRGEFGDVMLDTVNHGGVTNSYIDICDCHWVCEYCHAAFWYDERVKRYDDSVNRRRGPFVFKISGHIYHWIGSLCPAPTDPPRFLQLYIYDIQNEVSNRTLGEIVFKSGPNTRTDYDVIIESRDGFYPEMRPRRDVDKRLSMNQYYMFQLHERLDSYALLFRGGRLFQQYVVGVFCCIEQNRLDFYRFWQNDIRREYLSGVYDAICRGDREGSEIGGRLILLRTFTGGPRYMYSHYLDALAICRALGNP